jgi:hypothetical protein
MGYNINQEQRGGSRAIPPPVTDHMPMTVGKTARQVGAEIRQQASAETPAGLAFTAYQVAVDAQRALNREADAAYNSDEPTLTEQGWRDKKATIQNSPAATVVDLGEQAVLARQAEAHKRFDALIASMVTPGDAAQEQRNSRYANRIQRQLDAAKDGSEKVQIAQRLMESADRSQRGVLCEELPSHFADTSWMAAKWREIDPEIAAAVQDCVKSDQIACMSRWAAERVRRGFKSGQPPSQIGKLAEAVSKYDPDQ